MMRRFATIALTVSVLVVAVASPGAPGKAVKATDLTRELAKDEKAVDTKYTGKLLTVEGKVAAVRDEAGSLPMIRLAGHDEATVKQFEVPYQVWCYFPSAQRGKVGGKVQKGMTVKVRGEVQGASQLGRNVSLAKCELVK